MCNGFSVKVFFFTHFYTQIRFSCVALLQLISFVSRLANENPKFKLLSHVLQIATIHEPHRDVINHYLNFVGTKDPRGGGLFDKVYDTS